MDSTAVIVTRERTDHQIVNFTMEWSISRFSLYKDSDEKMYCAGLTMADLGITDHQGRFRISVKPGRRTSTCDTKFVSAFLCITDTPVESQSYTAGESIRAEFQMRLTTGAGGHVTIPIVDDDEDPHLIYTFSRETPEWGFPMLITHRLLFGSDTDQAPYIVDDCITISVDVTLDLPSATVRVLSTRQAQVQEGVFQHSTAFAIRSTDGREFHTNRFLLMAHSPVFDAMLSRNSTEPQLPHYDPSDLDGESVEILLTFITTGDTSEITGDNVEKVLMMADTYQVIDLRLACETMLTNNVTVGNAVHCLILARQRELTGLKEAALRLIAGHMGVVLSNAALAEAVSLDPGVLQEILVYCSNAVQPVP